MAGLYQEEQYEVVEEVLKGEIGRDVPVNHSAIERCPPSNTTPRSSNPYLSLLSKHLFKKLGVPIHTCRKDVTGEHEAFVAAT